MADNAAALGDNLNVQGDGQPPQDGQIPPPPPGPPPGPRQPVPQALGPRQPAPQALGPRQPAPPPAGPGIPAPPPQFQMNVNAVAAAAAAALLANMQPPPAPAHDMRPALLSLMDGNIPQFSGSKGEDARAHLLKFEDHILDLIALAGPNAEIHGPRAQVDKFKRTLTGKARKWFDHIHVPYDTHELREVFMDKYGREPTRTEDLMSMSQGTMRPNETVEAFGERISESMTRLHCAPEMIRDFFLMGLPVEMAMWVRNKEIPTFERALHYAKEWNKYKGASTAQNVDRGVHFAHDKGTDVMIDLISELKDLSLMAIKNTKNERSPTPHPRAQQDQPIENYDTNPPQNRQPYREDYYPQREQYPSRQGNDPGYQEGPQERRGRSPNRQNWPQNRQGRSPYRQNWPQNRQGRSPYRQNWPQNRQGRSPYRQEWPQNRQGRSPYRQNWTPYVQGQANWYEEYPNGPYDDQPREYPSQPRQDRSGSRQRSETPDKQGSRPPSRERSQGRPPSRERSLGRPPNPPQGATGPRQFTRGCWNCGEEDHFYRNCPKPKGNSTFQQRSERTAMRAFLTDLDGTENPNSSL